MHTVVRLVVAIVIVILLPCCGSHTKKNKKAAFQRAAFLLSEVETQIDINQNVVELEAKLMDIPTVIGSRTLSLIQISEQPQQLRLEIECKQSLAEIDAYYAEQMLYNGWQQITVVKDSQEIMHVYKKPLKICIIIMMHTSKTLIDIVVSEMHNEI